MHISFTGLTSKASFSLVMELAVLRFFLGGRTGVMLDFSLKVLDAADMHVIPFLLLGFFSFDFMCAIRDLYNVAAITIASSDV